MYNPNVMGVLLIFKKRNLYYHLFNQSRSIKGQIILKILLGI